ncbi:family A G protein-coupled receptor-like protein, partial [Aspergillus ellipticus CBS 707.79]
MFSRCQDLFLHHHHDGCLNYKRPSSALFHSTLKQTHSTDNQPTTHLTTMDILSRANDALSTNPPTVVIETLSHHGSDFLWAVTAIYILAFLILLTLCFTAPETNRVFHYLYTISLLVGATTYYAQASSLGWTAVPHTQTHPHQLFYARYINWTISFPSLALALGLLSGVSWTTIICNIALTWLWILAYLAAAFTASSYKWGFFAFGTLAYLILAMSTLNESREAAAKMGVKRDYVLLATWANVLWLCYPVAFAVSDSADVLGVTAGAVFFGVLDVLLMPVLGLGFVVL